jgi:hypothetical protein
MAVGYGATYKRTACLSLASPLLIEGDGSAGLQIGSSAAPIIALEARPFFPSKTCNNSSMSLSASADFIEEPPFQFDGSQFGVVS